MSFKLSNAIARFQDYINKILSKKLNIFVIVYLNHIFIYIENLSQNYLMDVRFFIKTKTFYQPEKISIL